MDYLYVINIIINIIKLIIDSVILTIIVINYLFQLSINNFFFTFFLVILILKSGSINFWKFKKKSKAYESVNISHIKIQFNLGLNNLGWKIIALRKC